MERSKAKADKFRFIDEEKREKVIFSLKCIFSCAVGLLLARAKIFGSLSPLGLAFSAAAGSYALAASVGALVGYLLSFSGTAGIRYMACVAGIALINFSVSRLRGESSARKVAPIASALCCASTGIAVLLVEGFSLNGIVSFLADCVLAGGMTYFFSRSLALIDKRKETRRLGRRDIICAAISCCAALAALAEFDIMNFRPAGTAAAFIVMLLCFTLREAGGAFGGICSGIALAAACGDPALGAVYSTAGLCAGLFYQFGQLGISAAFICICGISAVISPNPQTIAAIAESAAAALIFVLIPRTKLEKLRDSFSPAQEYAPSGERGELCRRLGDAESALEGVGQCIERVGKKIDSARPDEPEIITARVKQSVCAACGKCAGKNEKLRERTFSDAVKILREENHITSAELGTEFCAECPKASAVAENFNRVFASSVASACAAQKTNQLRRAVADSFGAMADILGEIGAETAKSDMFLPSQTSAASDTLDGLGMNVISACCKRDGSGHIILTAKITELPENAVLREATNALSKELGAALALPAIRDIENGVELTFSEKPRFCFEIGSDQRPGSDDGDCGDCYDCVGLEDGRNVIILSDGMGTGRRAAVDSAMATDLFASLICSGLSCEAALRTVNTALIAKSEDESLATLDIASLDPYSGEISFFKAGAAPCFIKRSGRTAILELPSLPAGILSRIGFSKAGAELREGDTVVMISDGVAADGSEWITKLIRSWRGDAQGLAEELTAAALSRRKGKKSDDMTAICVRIHSADRIGN